MYFSLDAHNVRHEDNHRYIESNAIMQCTRIKLVTLVEAPTLQLTPTKNYNWNMHRAISLHNCLYHSQPRDNIKRYLPYH